MGAILTGLMGAKRSGKDTFGGILVDSYGFQRFAFADVMKESLLALDPIIGYDGHVCRRLSEVIDAIGWDAAKEQYREIRRLVQAFGTEVGRDILGEDIWVNALRPQILDALFSGQNVVITDCRFVNEILLVSELGGDLFRIDRPGLPDDDNHRSEQEWRQVQPDWIYLNDGPLSQMDEFANYYVGRKMTDSYV